MVHLEMRVLIPPLSCGAAPIRRTLCALAAAANVVAALDAAAFVLSDGSSIQCVVGGSVVSEVYASPDDAFAKLGRTGLAERVEGGYRITWHTQRLNGLPPEVRDFIFFHECAHARVPTENELEANCFGLLDMRAAGRAGPTLERKLRGYFPGNTYWSDTFACADAGGKWPDLQKKPN